MKKTFLTKLLSLALVLILTAAALAGCSGAKQDDPFVLIKTLGDLSDLVGTDSLQEALYPNYYVYVFHWNDADYRAIIPLTEDVAQALYDLDYDDEDYQERHNALARPLEIERIENLTEQIPAQKELDEQIGRSGEELLNDGWYPFGFDQEKTTVYMNFGLFSYDVTFDGRLENCESADFDIEEAIRPLTVKKVVWKDLGNAAGLEEGASW